MTRVLCPCGHELDLDLTTVELAALIAAHRPHGLRVRAIDVEPGLLAHVGPTPPPPNTHELTTEHHRS